MGMSPRVVARLALASPFDREGSGATIGEPLAICPITRLSVVQGRWFGHVASAPKETIDESMSIGSHAAALSVSETPPGSHALKHSGNISKNTAHGETARWRGKEA